MEPPSAVVFISSHLLTMATTVDILLSDLPVEILSHIFSFLPLSDRKSVSLVCHSWNEQAFNRRLLRNVALSLSMDWEQAHLDALRKSTRKYRNVFAFFGPETCGEFDFELVNEVLEMFGQGLESFHCMTNFTAEQTKRIMSCAPNLTQLIAGVDVRSLSQQKSDLLELQCLRDLGSLNNMLQFHDLSAPNLTRLSANFTTRSDADGSSKLLRRLAPQLKNVELFATEYFIPIEDLDFPKLEVLKLSGQMCKTNDNALRTFFSRLKHLREVRLDFNVEKLVLDVITTASPGIEILHFKNSGLNPYSICYLERLKNLKVLSLVVSIYCSGVLDCKPLESVERFCLQLSNLDDEERIMEGFRRLLPNVTDMNVTLTTLSRPEYILGHVSRNFSHIKRLTIADTQYRMLSCRLFQVLRHMKQLEELTLKCIRVPVVFMLPNQYLHRLKIQNFHWLIDKDLLMLPEMYPNLKYLELTWCKKVTAKGVKKLRSLLKDCVVHVDKTTFSTVDVL
ncbi:uncharacterized protein LOC134216397 [Armigeres subalbatus]|uniref:uncharacterized protein LOC134216397 n=1 Tax=Armigeres subalbatus TaxID=124917 RepID=UPI002ED4F836